MPTSVLILDPTPDVAESTADLLSLYGYDARTATTADQALRAAAPDVLVLEPHFPGADGFALARRIGAARVVVVTTGERVEDCRRTAAAGAVAHLVKPADPVALHELLRALAPDRRA